MLVYDVYGIYLIDLVSIGSLEGYKDLGSKSLYKQECFGCQGFSHMKQECPIYLKTIGKSKTLAAMLSDTKPEDDSDN